MAPSIFASLDPDLLDELEGWIASIPLEHWPQQNRDHPDQIKPAMVNDPRWQGFGARSHAIVQWCTNLFAIRDAGANTTIIEMNRMLSVVMPGATIPPHADPTPPGWKARIHVPIITGADAWFIQHGRASVLHRGCAWRVDIGERHAVWNAGIRPRCHLMFDLYEA